MMRVLDNINISGSMNLASNAKDTFTIGSILENTDINTDNLVVYANADFKNNVTLGSSSVDVINISGTVTASSGITLKDSSLYITGSGTFYYNGMDVFASMGGGAGGGGNNGGGEGGGDNKTNAIEQILPGNDILVSTSGTTATISFDSASLDGYAFLLNSSSFTPQTKEKTVYFSFNPHYNNVTYFNANSQYENLKSAFFAVSDRSMSIGLPPVQTHLGKTFTFINATYVGTASSNDTVGYSASAGGLFTTSGKYSVHKITFYPYTSGNYTDYIGSGKLTGYNNFSAYLITNAVTDYRLLVGQENETDQHNFITLQAVSSSQFGYTWMIRDVNDYVPFSVSAV